MARQKINILVSHRAEKDLQEIYEYLASHSPAAVDKVHTRIFKTLNRLRRFPQSGHWVKEFESKKYREVPVFHYRVIYRYHEDEKVIRIFTIRHGRRFMPKLLEREFSL